MNSSELIDASILLVDDTLENLHILLDHLRHTGFKLLIADSGEQAIQQLEYFQPDLILLDIIMPGMDGFETCRRLKAQDATQDIPVIFMTALTETVDKVAGFAVGGVDYITKPFQVEEVLARVKTHITLRRQQQQLHAQNAQLQQQNALIEAQRQQLSEANASKDTFFSIIAHDLKNPLVAFKSAIHLLNPRQTQLPEDTKAEIFDELGKQTEHLYTLLENLLTWAQVQRGQLVPHPQTFNAALFVIKSLMQCAAMAAQKQITLANEIPDPLIISADVMMLETILRNLVTNSVKFTKAGGIVTISAHECGEMIEMAVSDTGIGIEPERVAMLFRIDGKSKRIGTAGEKGTGLGLILCKEFVEKHGGNMNIESTLGIGTTVKFTLPKGQ